MMKSSFTNTEIIMKNGCVATGIASYPPYFDFNGTHYVGFNVLIFEMLMEKVGLCYTYVSSPDGLWGSIMENGSWNGVVGLADRQVAVNSGDYSVYKCHMPDENTEVEVIVLMAMTYQRYKVIDFTEAMAFTSYSILYPRPIYKPNYLGFLMPFSTQTWLIILAIQMLLIIITILIKNHVMFMDTHTEESESQSRKRERSFNLHVMWVYMVLLSQPIVNVQKGTVGRLLIMFWLTVTLIIGLIYKSNLKALLISPKVLVPFDNLVDLVNQKEYKWAFLDGSIIASYFKPAYEEDRNSVMGKGWELKSEMYTDPDKIASLIIDKKLACIDSTMKVVSVISDDFSKHGECRFALASERLFYTGLSIGLKKGSVLREILNPYILRLKESGILDKILGGDLFNATYCDYPSGKGLGSDKDLRALTVEDFLGTFYILIGGWMISTLAFVCEIFSRERSNIDSQQSWKIYRETYN